MWSHKIFLILSRIITNFHFLIRWNWANIARWVSDFRELFFSIARTVVASFKPANNGTHWLLNTNAQRSTVFSKNCTLNFNGTSCTTLMTCLNRKKCLDYGHFAYFYSPKDLNKLPLLARLNSHAILSIQYHRQRCCRMVRLFFASLFFWFLASSS